MTTTDDEATPLPAARTTDSHGTDLRKGAIGVFGIVFFVLSAQAPLTGIAGALPLTIFLGNGAGAPGAYLAIGLIITLFAVGFIAMSRRVDAKGAFYAYVGAGLGRRVGTGSAWLAMLAYATVQAAMYGLFGASVSALLSGLGLTIPWWLPVLITIAIVQVLGSLNIELGARVLVILVGCEVAILLAFAFVALALHGGSHGSIDFAASFSPAAVMAGAPGVALVFAVASMFGFESTAIYSGEAKDPKRTVARATYLSVALIAVFFSFVSWMFVSYYGAGHVADAAKKAVVSGDSTGFVFGALSGLLGGWAGVVANILLITSLFAGLLAFHNGINRYLHALGSQGSLPKRLARTNRHLAPSAAAWVQTIMTVVLVAPFAILNLDPILTLFSWFSGLSVAALVTLYVLCSIAVVVYSLRHRTGGVWQTRIAPVASAVLLLGVLLLVITNFTSLIGGEVPTAIALLVVVPIAFAVGLLLERHAKEPLDAETD
jgi:amino acid transporter